MNKENNNGTQSFFNGTTCPLTSKSRTSENTYENQEASSTIKKESEFSKADPRLLPYHLYFSSKL
jgi:hypothetical protein